MRTPRLVHSLLGSYHRLVTFSPNSGILSIESFLENVLSINRYQTNPCIQGSLDAALTESTEYEYRQHWKVYWQVGAGQVATHSKAASKNENHILDVC